MAFEPENDIIVTFHIADKATTTLTTRASTTTTKRGQSVHLLCFINAPEKTVPFGDCCSMRELVHFGYQTMEGEVHVVEVVCWLPRMR